jgi:hypothetical protein
MNLSNLMLSLDIFAQGVELRINKETKSRTILGGILSVVMVVFLLIMFFFQAQDVFYRRNPQISIEQQVTGEFPEIILDGESFPLAIALTDYSNTALDFPRYFRLSLYTVSGLTSGSLNETNYPLVHCKKEFFPRISQHSYDSLNMDNFYCTENQKISLKGSWGDSYISYLEAKISVCKNETENGTCASPEEIKEFIKKDIYYWNIYYQNTNINPQDAEIPLTYTIVNYYNLIKLGFRKIIQIYPRRQTLNSDYGFIMKSMHNNHSVAWDYFTYDESIEDESGTLVEFNFLVSQNYLIYHRAYLKIQTVLASVGGLANVFKIVFIGICYVFSQVKRDEAILNKIFDFDIGDRYVNAKIFDNEPSKSPNINKNKPDLHSEEILKSNPLKKEDNPSFNKSNLDHSGCLLNLSEIRGDKKSTRNSVKPPIANKLMQEKIQPVKPVANSYRKNNFNFNFQNLGKKNDLKSEKLGNVILSSYKKSTVKSMKVYEADLKLNSRQKYLKIFGDFTKVKEPEKQEEILMPRYSVDNIKFSKKNTIKDFADMPKKAVIELDKRIKINHDVRNLMKKINKINRGYMISFSFMEIVQIFFCCQACANKKLNLKKKLYMKSNFFVEQYMDITYIINKLEELEKLKIVLLNPEQLALFNFLSKELISEDETKIRNHDITVYKKFCSSKDNLANVIVRFKEKINKHGILSHTDSKLYSFLYDEFKQ